MDQNDDTSGVSCESCHGAARDYLDQHGLIQKSGQRVKPFEEDPADAAARVARACEEGGMIASTRFHSRSFVEIADNCFGCHTVPDERLVNEAGHPAGSAMDFVDWSQGIIRHNFHRSSSDKKSSAKDPDRENVAASAADLRVFHVVGNGVDLEFGLRGLAKATSEGAYATAMVTRIGEAEKALRSIQAAAATPQVQEALAALDGAALGPGNQADLSARADRVRAAIEAFAQAHDGSALGAIDSLVPSSRQGTPFQR